MDLIYPGDPEFDYWLGIPPPDYSPNYALVADSQTGILRPVAENDLRDYLWGGEYDERLEAIGENDFND